VREEAPFYSSLQPTENTSLRGGEGSAEGEPGFQKANQITASLPLPRLKHSVRLIAVAEKYSHYTHKSAAIRSEFILDEILSRFVG
jgi:hypothetical protein